MQIQRTFHGLEVELRSRGIGRFFSAGFLFVWLVGWVLGETVVVWILFVGGRALLTGMPPAPGRAPLDIAPALVMGVFLLGWLALWTLGGWLAAREFMRLLWSRDRLLVNRDALEVMQRVGFLSDARRFASTELRRIYRREAGTVLVAETSNDSFELTRLGT